MDKKSRKKQRKSISQSPCTQNKMGSSNPIASSAEITQVPRIDSTQQAPDSPPKLDGCDLAISNIEDDLTRVCLLYMKSSQSREELVDILSLIASIVERSEGTIRMSSKLAKELLIWMLDISRSDLLMAMDIHVFFLQSSCLHWIDREVFETGIRNLEKLANFQALLHDELFFQMDRVLLHVGVWVRVLKRDIDCNVFNGKGFSSIKFISLSSSIYDSNVGKYDSFLKTCEHLKNLANLLITQKQQSDLKRSDEGSSFQRALYKFQNDCSVIGEMLIAMITKCESKFQCF